MALKLLSITLLVFCLAVQVNGQSGILGDLLNGLLGGGHGNGQGNGQGQGNDNAHGNGQDHGNGQGQGNDNGKSTDSSDPSPSGLLGGLAIVEITGPLTKIAKNLVAIIVKLGNILDGQDTLPNGLEYIVKSLLNTVRQLLALVNNLLVVLGATPVSIPAIPSVSVPPVNVAASMEVTAGVGK